MGYLKSLFDLMFINTKYILLLIEVGLILSLMLRKWKREVQANLLLAIVAVGFVLIMTVTAISFRWQLIVGLLPAVLVTYQAFFLWLYQPKQVKQKKTLAWETEMLDDYRERALNMVISQFGVQTLFIRYVFPAVLLGVAGIVALSVVVDPNSFLSTVLLGSPNAAKILLGIKLGSVGAYMYILLELGRRTFRHDITGASAMWCLVTIVLGPVLAAAVAVLWRIDGPTQSEWWGSGVILFFAGFAPRRVMAAIEQAAVQLLKMGGSGSVVQTRLIPLSRIRGIGAQIEERLSEEGITDVSAMATAEPVRLVRNTSFDLRQILSWIDEAILIQTLPKGWEALEDEGISGAIDLAWYAQYLNFLPTGKLDITQIPSSITELATKANLTPPSLAFSIQRLSEDTQVRYVWALYNSFTEFGGGSGADGASDGIRDEDRPPAP